MKFKPGTEVFINNTAKTTYIPLGLRGKNVIFTIESLDSFHNSQLQHSEVVYNLNAEVDGKIYKMLAYEKDLTPTIKLTPEADKVFRDIIEDL